MLSVRVVDGGDFADQNVPTLAPQNACHTPGKVKVSLSPIERQAPPAEACEWFRRRERHFGMRIYPALCVGYEQLQHRAAAAAVDDVLRLDDMACMGEDLSCAIMIFSA